ncbi:MAG: hypothetical protein DRP87_00265 [Spirochaetes bacterium]|nr:MAG: hypothetical protein DRP87_00265 [Spirochaetota bacterium]
MLVDLHIHSQASDGCWYPEQIVEKVKRAGIGLFAVADHDTVSAVSETERIALKEGLLFIRAVEITTSLDGGIHHVLAYGIDLTDPVLLRMMERNRKKLAGVNDHAIRKLISAGFPLDWEEYSDYRHEPSRGGWKAVNFVIDKGLCRNVKDFFERLLTGPLALEYPSFESTTCTVEAIHRAGGKAVWAHPGNSLKQDRVENLVEKMLDLGIDGLECYSPYHAEDQTRYFLGICNRNGLIATAGSDSHGGFAGRKLGEPRVSVNDLYIEPLLDYVLSPT